MLALLSSSGVLQSPGQQGHVGRAEHPKAAVATTAKA